MYFFKTEPLSKYTFHLFIHTFIHAFVQISEGNINRTGNAQYQRLNPSVITPYFDWLRRDLGEHLQMGMGCRERCVLMDWIGVDLKVSCDCEYKKQDILEPEIAKSLLEASTRFLFSVKRVYLFHLSSDLTRIPLGVFL